MPHDMYDERIRGHQPQKYAWEGQIAYGVEIADLNEKHIRGCIKLGVEGGRIPSSAMSAPLDDTLAKWNLMKDGLPTNGAVMLFSNKIDEYPQFRLRMARFLGTDKNEFIDNQRVEGNFFDLLDAGMAFFFKHLNLSGQITDHSLQRRERLEVPYHALREALINSLCHRQWEKHNLTGSIAIYDDRVEIANPGVFPSQLSPESIKQPHESYPYNLKIAEVLYKSTYLESWGSGAKRIMDACREQGLDEPMWRWDGGFVIVTFKRPAKNIGAKANPKENDIETVNYDKEVRQRNLSELQKRILELIDKKPEITLNELADRLEISISALRNQRRQMEKQGVFLCRKGATKKGYWEIKISDPK